MSWSSLADTKDKIFSALVYLLPLYESLMFGQFILQRFSVFAILEQILAPVGIIYGILNGFTFGFGELIIFFVLFLAVVRNPSISHFIRYNTMQSILFGIMLSLLAIVFQAVILPLGLGALSETLANVIFLGMLAACTFSIVQSLMGRYAEIPQFSQAVYSQVR